MKIMSNSIKLDSFKKQYGSWDIQTRKRQGLHYSSDYYSGSVVGVGLDRYTDRILSDSDLYTVYKRCSDVRASIDSIVRRVATFDWMVVPKVNPQNPKYAELMEICKMTNDFLMRPNRNGDTWQEIMTSMLTDCLVFDSGVLELVYDMSGNLQELVPIRGSTVSPIIDEYGRLIHYQQNIFEEGTYFSTPSPDNIEDTEFKAKQILYLSLFKNTATPEGFPIIESLVNEIIGLLRATEHAMLNLDADEVPPGILVLAGIAGKAAEEAKADLQRMKGQDHKVRVMTTPDPTGVGAKWLELRRQPKDIQMNEVIEQLRRAVYRTFGVMPVEMGMTQGMPKSTASVQMDVASSHLVTPMLELIQAKINAQIIPAVVNSKEVANLIEFKFDRESRLSPQEQLNLASTYRNYVTQGIMTRNEIRETLGLLPIIGGDVPTVEVAGMPQALESIITGYQSAAPQSENIKAEIGETLQDMEDKKEKPQFGNEPIDRYDVLASRSEELITNDITIDETINNIVVTVVDGKYLIENKRYEKIELAKGFTYIFDQSDKSNLNHPMSFSLKEDGTHSDGKEYTEGITKIGTAGEDGSQIRMTTDLDTPKIIYFYCKNHPNMGGVLDFNSKLIDTEDTIYEVLSTVKFSDLNKRIQKVISNKLKEHHKKVGDVKSKRTTKSALTQVYLRGVAAYKTNPESVRPIVVSREQWGIARINSFLYALEKGKFRNKPHDTDLLPEGHKHSTKGKSESKRSVSRYNQDFPKASIEESWGWEAGEKEKVLEKGLDTFRKAHAWYDPSNPNDIESYRLPIAKIVGDELKLVFRGVAAAMGAIKGNKKQSLKGIEENEIEPIYNLLVKYYNDFNVEAPKLQKRSFGVYGPIKESIYEEELVEEYDLDIPLIPYPNDMVTLSELKQLQGLEYQRRRNKDFIQLADDNLVLCFVDYLKTVQIDEGQLDKITKYMNLIAKQSSVLIMRLKYHFNRPRPYQVAKIAGIDFKPMDSKTASTPSYPSGHTIQSYLIAYKLSNIFPKYRNDFFDIAKRISNSRMIAGYHFQSDIDYGITIFRFIVNSPKENIK